jgi:DinB family protein
MNSELAAYDESICERIELIRGCIAGLTPAQLNVRPAFGGANSIWALAEHALGNARAWIIGIAAGNEIGRDRPGEFASSGDDTASLLAGIDGVARDVAETLRGIDPARLEVRLTPSQELWGEGPPHEISVRDAIIQVIEHLSLHLGHIHVTRDLVLARSRPGAAVPAQTQPGAAVPRQS